MSVGECVVLKMLLERVINGDEFTNGIYVGSVVYACLV